MLWARMLAYITGIEDRNFFQGTAHNIKQQQQVMGLPFLSSFAPATGRAPRF